MARNRFFQPQLPRKPRKIFMSDDIMANTSGSSSFHDGLSRRRFLKLCTLGGAGVGLASRGLPEILAQTTPTGPGAIRFALLGDFGETLADQTYPVDRVGAMIRSWNPDWVVSVGDNNYILGQAETIDVNIGKNFTSFIYPKTTEIPVQYPYPEWEPPFNRFIPCLGNHDYGDVFNDMVPNLTNLAGPTPYFQYFRNALRVGTNAAPNTTIRFDDNAVGHSYSVDLVSGDVENYAPFQEAENLRYFDVRLGTASGPSSVHLFVFDSDPGTPYGRFATDQPILNRDGTPSGFTEFAVQARWLQQRLAASTARWKIVLFHHPPYNSAPGAATAQFAYVRWPFQAWGASAVITGHVHNYERLEMPDLGPNNQPDFSLPTIPYIVNGAGGFIPENGFDPSFVFPGSQVRVSEYGAQLITADDNSINFLYFDINGVLRDVKTLYANNSTGVPQVEFGGREFPVAAVAGTIQIPVQRLGNLSQPLTVQYATINGTAVAGVNYTAASGQLQFAAGQGKSTIPVQIANVPIFGPNQVPWESLLFNIALKDPTGGSLGFFSIANILLVNTVDTPINNQTLFIEQTYEDLFQRDATAGEILAAKAAIGISDTWNERATWINNLVGTSFATQPVFTIVQIFALLNLSLAETIAEQSEPPSYADLLNGLSLYHAQLPNLQAAKTAVSQAYNQNVLELVNSKVPGFATDNDLFILTIYKLVVLPLGTLPTQADFDYWGSQLSNASEAARSQSRVWMLARLATESFDPPPVAGMSVFDLPTKNRNRAIFGVLVPSLMRIQPTAPEFYGGYVFPADLGPIGAIDAISSMLQSSSYVARFTVTSFEGFLDSVKSTLPPEQKTPGADPDGNGLDNLSEYAFSITDGNPGDVTEFQVSEENGQQVGIFSYRQARNARDVVFLVEVSTDLTNWTPVSQALERSGEDRGAYMKRTIKIPIAPGVQRQFFRVRVHLRP
jgi:hypothetical protein